MSRLPILILLTICLVLPACGPDGLRKNHWTRKEFTEWHEGSVGARGGRAPTGYAGSDEHHHHFICRPMDTWVFAKIPREEITIADERPRSSLGSSQNAFYAVDPQADYRRIEDR